jgi:hypothetical protein
VLSHIGDVFGLGMRACLCKGGSCTHVCHKKRGEQAVLYYCLWSLQRGCRVAGVHWGLGKAGVCCVLGKSLAPLLCRGQAQFCLTSGLGNFCIGVAGGEEPTPVGGRLVKVERARRIMCMVEV